VPVKQVYAAGSEIGCCFANFVAAGDAAVKVPALTEWYGQMKDRPAVTDLDGLWKRLGVEASGGKDVARALMRAAFTLV
jgi:hypothetical protein